MACFSVVPYKLGLANETLTVAAVAPTKSTWKSDALACLAPKRTCCHQRMLARLCMHGMTASKIPLASIIQSMFTATGS